jgi:hypothetical protein
MIKAYVERVCARWQYSHTSSTVKLGVYVSKCFPQISFATLPSNKEMLEVKNGAIRLFTHFTELFEHIFDLLDHDCGVAELFCRKFVVSSDGLGWLRPALVGGGWLGARRCF